MYKNMWKDRSTHSVFEAIAKAVLRYPVTTIIDSEEVKQVVSVTDAENIYGETIYPTKIMAPHLFQGRI
jgi:hypothetical protein